MRKKNEFRLSLPEDRLAEKKEEPKIPIRWNQEKTPFVLPDKPKDPTPTRVIEKHKATRRPSAERDKLRREKEHEEWLKVFMKRAWDVVDGLEIPRSKVREIKHINRGVCYLMMVDGSKRFATMGNIQDWWEKYA